MHGIVSCGVKCVIFEGDTTMAKQIKAKVKAKAEAKAKATKPEGTAIKIKFAYDGALITKNLTTIKANDDAQEKLVHSTALACIAQIMMHRNSDFATRLLNGLGKGWRTESFVKWMTAFAPVSIKRVKQGEATVRTFKCFDETDPHWISAQKKLAKDADKFFNLPTFWDFDPEVTEYKGVDLIALIERAVKKVEGANVYPKGHAKEGQPLSKEDAAKNNSRGLVEARALVARMKANVAAAPAAMQ